MISKEKMFRLVRKRFWFSKTLFVRGQLRLKFEFCPRWSNIPGWCCSKSASSSRDQWHFKCRRANDKRTGYLIEWVPLFDFSGNPPSPEFHIVYLYLNVSTKIEDTILEGYIWKRRKINSNSLYTLLPQSYPRRSFPSESDISSSRKTMLEHFMCHWILTTEQIKRNNLEGFLWWNHKTWVHNETLTSCCSLGRHLCFRHILLLAYICMNICVYHVFSRRIWTLSPAWC